MRAKTIALAFGLAAVALATGSLAGAADARSLEAIKARGLLSLCAHPNALPFASRSAEQGGFQIDIAHELAVALDVVLVVDWIVTRYHPSRVDCDLILDSIDDQQAQEDRGVHLSRPYQESGVALAVRRDKQEVEGFADLANGERVGVLSGSLASMVLGQRGLATIPFGFEDDMVEALIAGEIDAAAVSPFTAAYYNHKNGGRALRLVHAYESEPELRWTLAVGMRRADRPLVRAIDAALQRLIADGTLKRIYAQYGIEHRPPLSR